MTDYYFRNVYALTENDENKTIYLHRAPNWEGYYGIS
jgi:hypothetical protein